MIPSVESRECRKQRIAELRAELKELEATPRSDWHAGFEAVLRIETHKYGNLVHIRTEEEIGEIPARTDFVILIEDEKVEFDKAIFKIFRRINILEYKNPHDSLNERVLRKICGYANLYIGVAEHEGERPSDEVTLSIFRAVKNPELFSELERNGNLHKSAPGIYHVTGITDLPFQIIITDELDGEEYAAYHTLSDKAKKADIERIIRNAGKEQDDVVREHYRVLLKLVLEKNPQYIDIMKGEVTMRDVLLEIVKDTFEERLNERVNERLNERVNATKRETLVSSIKNVMSSFGVTIEKAMDSLKIPMAQRQTYAGLVQQSL